MQAYVWVAVGSAIGGVARFWTSGVVARLLGVSFPWGTLIENVLGSFIIGVAAALTAPDGRWPDASMARLFILTGLCGGYTTFSAFSLETLTLMRNGEWLYAGWNILLSVTVCLLAVWLGHTLATTINPAR